MFGKKVTLWESVVSPNYIMHYKASFPWILSLLYLFALVFYIYSFFAAYKIANSFWFGVIATSEFIIMLILGALTIAGSWRVHRFSTKQLGKDFREDNTNHSD